MASPFTGCVGNVSFASSFSPEPDCFIVPGFLMTFAYSPPFELAVISSLCRSADSSSLVAGITYCSFFRNGMYNGKTKVIVIAATEPFFDCTGFLDELAGFLENSIPKSQADNLKFYVEKFGYDRFFVQWENDNPFDIRVSEILSEFTADAALKITGGSSVEEFPPFLGTVISLDYN